MSSTRAPGSARNRRREIRRMLRGTGRAHRGLAQLVEQRIPNPQVVGSSPSAPARDSQTQSRITDDRRRRRQSESAPPKARRRGRAKAAAGLRCDDADVPTRRDARRPDAVVREGAPDDAERRGRTTVAPVAPTQLGARRFVYAAYFAGAIAHRVHLVEGRSISPGSSCRTTSRRSASRATRSSCRSSALIGAGAALYYWYRTRARELAEEVATEMSKVTGRRGPRSPTAPFVVIVTTIVSTVFFALMDKFWGFVTNLVYGGT